LGLAVHSMLHINASPRQAASKSLAIAQEFITGYQDCHADLKVDTWHLFEDPLPDYATTAAAAKMSAFAGQLLTGAEAEEWAKSRLVFERFIAADEYVFNVPMWNHGVPYVLKQWIDLITQPGWVFGFHPEHGYSGLVEGKRAVVVYTSGVYRPGGRPGFGADFHSTFFNDWLRFIGITDITELRYNGNNLLAPEEEADAWVAQYAQARDVAASW
jgi:FMN-dependent NADH-azoreductase